MELREALVLHRRAAKMTQEQLAEAADMERSTLAKIETGGQGIYTNQLEQLAEGLHVTPSSIYMTAEGSYETVADIIDAIERADRSLDWREDRVGLLKLAFKIFGVLQGAEPTRPQITHWLEWYKGQPSLTP